MRLSAFTPSNRTKTGNPSDFVLNTPASPRHTGI